MAPGKVLDRKTRAQICTYGLTKVESHRQRWDVSLCSIKFFAVVCTIMLGHNTKAAIGTGSGCSIASNRVITAYHVVKDASSIKVFFENGQSCDAVVQDYDQSLDWAILATAGARSGWANIGDAKGLDIGQKVAVLQNRARV